jgi:membrane fusion protein YbhG
MKTPKRKRIAAIVLAAIIIIGGGWYAIANLVGNEDSVFASGFIEGTTVNIAPEIGGSLSVLHVDEGDHVKAGAVLVELDDALLQAEKRLAEAAVLTAEAGLNQAIATRDGAKKSWENAVDIQQNPIELNASTIAAQAALDVAEYNLQRALDTGMYYIVAEARVRRDAAAATLDSLQQIQANPQAINAEVDRTHTVYQSALAAASAAGQQLVQAGTTLEIIEIKLAKMKLTSPVDGIVATRHNEVGEVIGAGRPVLTVVDLEEVTLTAYITERDIGRVMIGQTAAITVNSYPDKVFDGKVSYISPQALFTPKNIQLKEDQAKMVFAVKIIMPNSGYELKPGMPAQAQILTADAAAR